MIRLFYNSQINAADPEVKEILDAYRLTSPCIKVFRRGNMGDYRGPENAKGMSDFIIEDSRPSIRRLSSISEIQAIMKGPHQSIVLGIFESSDITENSVDSYSMDAWGQFQAAADSLRG